MDVGFYHLTRSTLEAALGPLLAKTLAAGQRAVVRCGSQAGLEAIDKALWLHEAFLPHGTEDAALQPIWLTLDEARANGGGYLFLAAAGAGMEGFARVFDLFDGTDADAVTAARGRWAAAKANGHVLTYWQQGEAGWRKAAG